MSSKRKRIKNPSRGSEINLAYIDDLTGLYNRRYLNTLLSKEINKANDKNKKLSLFMIDCDGFKNINDTHGHLIGDQTLITVAGILKKGIGKGGTVTRYAGDEFTIIVPEKDSAESLKTANRLLELIAESGVKLKDGKKTLNITLSIGIATYPDDSDKAKELINKADQALYSSKRTGKNKVSTVKDCILEIRDREMSLKAVPCEKFINREKELKFLKKNYEQAKAGEKKFILIEGEAGVGKRRLGLELFNHDKAYPPLLLNCQKETLQEPYGAIANGLNSFLNCLDPKKVLDSLNSLNDIHKYALTAMVSKIKSLPIGYRKKIAFNIKYLHRQDISLAFRNLLKKLDLQMIPILINDITWIDNESLEIIRWLLEESKNKSVFIAGTMPKNTLNTPVKQETSLRNFLNNKNLHSILQTITLEPLTEKAVSKLLNAVFSGLALPSDFMKKIYQISRGLPSSIEEIIKYLLSNKVIYPLNGEWIFAKDSFDETPSSFKGVLDKRISELDDESKDILSKAAILGDNFDVNILKLFSGKNEGQLLDILDKLRDKGIFDYDFLPEEGFRFANKAIKETAYNTIGKKELQKLNKEVAELLGNNPESGINKTYAKLMHHLKESGETANLKYFLAKLELPPYIEETDTEEFEPSLEEITETYLSEKSKQIVPDMLFWFRSTWVNSQSYSPNNEIRINSIKNIDKQIRAIFENDQTLTLAALEQNILLNGQPLNKGEIQQAIVNNLLVLFNDYGISSITFKKGVNIEELDSFFSLFSNKQEYLKTPDLVAKTVNITNIKINKIRYQKVSDGFAKVAKTNTLLKEMLLKYSAGNDLFAADDKGITINKEMLSDVKKATDSLLRMMGNISKQDTSQNSKQPLISELLNKTKSEFEKADKTQWAKMKAQIGKQLLSLEPLLRAKIIQKSIQGQTKENNAIGDILSEFSKENIIKILSEGNIKTKMSSEEFTKFLKAVLKSETFKNLSYQEALSLFKKAGVEKMPAAAEMIGNDSESFSFKKIEKEMATIEKTGTWDKKSLENLKPLVNNFIKKNAKKSIEKLAKSFSNNLKSYSPLLRIFALDALGQILEVLLENDIFDLSDVIVNMLATDLENEDNINVYLGFMKQLEILAIVLLEKRNFPLLITVSAIIKKEISASDQKPDAFKSCAENTINEIFSAENIDNLLIYFTKSTTADSSAMVDLMAQLSEIALNPLMELLEKEDDMRLDPLDIYMKKRYIAIIMKKIGKKAIAKLKNSLDDNRLFVIKNIIDVFAHMDDKIIIPYLEQVSQHSDKEVQTKAKNVLKKVKKDIAEQKK